MDLRPIPDSASLAVCDGCGLVVVYAQPHLETHEHVCPGRLAESIRETIAR
jgi:hypothetical protein